MGEWLHRVQRLKPAAPRPSAGTHSHRTAGKSLICQLGLMRKPTPNRFSLGLPRSMSGRWLRQSASLVRTLKTSAQADAFHIHGIGKNSHTLRVYQRTGDFVPAIVSRAAIFASARTIPEFVMTAPPIKADADAWGIPRYGVLAPNTAEFQRLAGVVMRDRNVTAKMLDARSAEFTECEKSDIKETGRYAQAIRAI